ncbi:MAG: DNA recombination protein RmuC [Burkholderiaceae bacterium]|nr:DNA recombination protein RmuC [Burkholderiaceae bacterium]
MLDPVFLGVIAVAALLLALVAVIALVLVVRANRSARLSEQIAQAQARQDAAAERLERELREAVSQSARDLRGETGARLTELQTGLVTQIGSVAQIQTTQLGGFGQQLARLGEAGEASSRANREESALQLQNFSNAMQQQLAELQRGITLSLAEVRSSVQAQLATLQQGNEAKLDQMRATVEEKLQTTLEARLGESFRQVSERLEQVHRGLGEMQGLAQGVGDLKRVLTNVKSRGSFGEVQLAALLEQVLTAEQYAANVATRPGSGERVEFAVKMPGRGDLAGASVLWLPIDAKFPSEDYERLLAAQEAADVAAMESAGSALELRIRAEARKIRDKYVEPPYTTDFAILFLPTEGLFAEVLRRPGLTESLNREQRIVVAGPTTLFALLNSLQMGFRTLAIEQRSAEVRELLGAVKTEFGRFGEWIGKVRAQVATVSKTLDDADTRTKQMQRKLREVEALPADRSAQLLPPVADEP